MNTPHYVVKNVGGRFVSIPRTANPLASTAWILGGTCLAVRGVRRGGLRGGVAFLWGIAFIVRGALGYNPLAGQHPPDLSGDDAAAQAPSYQNDAAGRSPQLPEDLVDEQSMESFPASDPPARTGIASTGPRRNPSGR